jgi:Predicted membrane protein
VVEPGTDGAVTWQGELAGLCGALLVAAIGFVGFSKLGLPGASVVAAAGIVGMTVDSLLGATLEGQLVGNQGVNLLATLAAALVGAGLAVAVGLTAL